MIRIKVKLIINNCIINEDKLIVISNNQIVISLMKLKFNSFNYHKVYTCVGIYIKITLAQRMVEGGEDRIRGSQSRVYGTKESIWHSWG